MSTGTTIEWTEATYNPFRGTKGRHHCVRISPGCKNCYAAAMNVRFKGPDYVVGADTPRLDLLKDTTGRVSIEATRSCD